MRTSKFLGFIAVVSVCLYSNLVIAEGPLDEDGHVINFVRDVAPILRQRCLECHGPEDAKNDFRVDDQEIMADYIEAEDSEGSTLYVDYLVTDDSDLLMPPESEGGPLSASELAVLRLWIDEGAVWPEDAQVVAAEASNETIPEATAVKVKPNGIAARVWAFQGYLHPATVHFPVALLLVGGLFVVLGFRWPQLAHPIPFACLLLGAGSAIVASMMGWSFADQEGYGSWTRGLDASIARHRWAGIAVTIAAVAFSLVAIKAELSKNLKLRKVWQIGLLLCASIVGLVGHIGGELTYGEQFYHEAFEVLLGTDSEVAES